MKSPRFDCNYIFHANLLDRIDGRTNLKNGDEVKVVRVSGVGQVKVVNCQHVYVGDAKTGHFIGMVHVNSIHTKKDYIAYLKAEMAKHDRRND